jgi:hypothetical protein
MGDPLNERPFYDDLHVIDMREAGAHSVGRGPGGCFCEPVVIDIFRIGNVCRRTILHQRLADTDEFYREYEERCNADHTRN